MRDAAAIERRNRQLEHVLHGDLAELDREAAAERYAGLLRIERGPAAFRLTFPAAKDRWAECRPIMEAVKAIPGRRYDPFTKAWSIPADRAESVQALASQYAAEIEELALAAGFDAEAAARIAQLEAELNQRDVYIAGLEAELAEREGAAA